VPVMVQRNGVRGVVYGLGDGYLELRHLLADADVRADDLLVTSGLDGVFPAGIPVARVVSVDTGAGFPISCASPWPWASGGVISWWSNACRRRKRRREVRDAGRFPSGAGASAAAAALHPPYPGAGVFGI